MKNDLLRKNTESDKKEYRYNFQGSTNAPSDKTPYSVKQWP